MFLIDFSGWKSLFHVNGYLSKLTGTHGADWLVLGRLFFKGQLVVFMAEERFSEPKGPIHDLQFLFRSA